MPGVPATVGGGGGAAGGGGLGFSGWAAAAYYGDLAGQWVISKIFGLGGPGYDPRGFSLWGRGRGQVNISEPNDLSGARYYSLLQQSIIDDGSGTYTGTNGEDIVFPPAIARYLLIRIGFDTVSTYVTTGSSTFGSFATAFSDLNTLAGIDWEVIARYTQTQTVEDALRGLTYQAPVTFWRSMLDGKMKCQMYKTTPASQDYFQDLDSTTYAWKYSEDMIEGSVRVGLTPKDEIVNEVHVKFKMFAPTGEFLADAWVGPTGSDNGTGTADESGTGDREDQAIASRDHFGSDPSTTYNGFKRTLNIYADQIYLPTLAVKLRNTLFDRFQRPRILLQFDTWGRATTMDLHMNTKIDNELQDYVPVPKYNYTGAAVEWNDLIFYVRKKRIFNDNGRIRHRILLEEVPQPL